jgi:NAD(P)-dependent dehydrogenase (short-subunit alcohol dehydrogenase family)
MEHWSSAEPPGWARRPARRLRAQGAALTIADVNAEKGEALADELGVAFVACDVREEDQVQAAVAAAAAADGRPAHLRVLRRHRDGRRRSRARAGPIRWSPSRSSSPST